MLPVFSVLVIEVVLVLCWFSVLCCSGYRGIRDFYRLGGLFGTKRV